MEGAGAALPPIQAQQLRVKNELNTLVLETGRLILRRFTEEDNFQMIEIIREDGFMNIPDDLEDEGLPF